MEPMIPINCYQDVNNESSQVTSVCLAVPVNYEARSLMRNRGNLTASINKNHTCQDLRAFASDLQRMKQISRVAPFSGMTFTVGGWKCANKDYCQQSPNEELEPVYEDILSSLTWKHLSVRHLRSWEEHKSCPGFILSKKILKELDSVLEELSIQLQWHEAKSFSDEFLQDCHFSRLRTFRLLNDFQSYKSEWSDLIKTVVSSAPNLQVLRTKNSVDLDANLLEGSSAVHMAGSTYTHCLDSIPESVASKIRMQGMELIYFSDQFSLERFNRITSMLLQSSSASMNSMNINVMFLAPLVLYDICLENVRDVQLYLDLTRVEEMLPAVWRIAKSFDFTRIFPNLDTVTIMHMDHLRSNRIPAAYIELIDQINATLNAPSPDRAANIKHLKLNNLPFDARWCSSSFQLLAQMFPHVQKLSAQTSVNPFIDVRDFWVDLKEVDVTFKCMVRARSRLDCIFCGIFPEEVAQLREQDEEYLRAVNIVPVMPTIANLKELRTLEMYCEKDRDGYTGPLDDPTCLLSKVTTLTIFERRPNLTVTITSEDERFSEALSHLKPYASVVYKNMNTFIRNGS